MKKAQKTEVVKIRNSGAAHVQPIWTIMRIIPPMRGNGGRVITIQQAAKKNGVSPATVLHACWEGRIPGCERFGRDWQIPEGWVYVKGAVGWPKGRLRGTQKKRVRHE